MSHRKRPRFARSTPVHVTLRTRDHVWNLRSRRSFDRIRAAFEKARGRFGMRLIHFSVLGNHLHLIVEADDDQALARGMKGLEIRIAKALNAMMERSGAVFDDHYHADLLPTPTQLVNAIRYVMTNAQHHYGELGTDPYSSAGLAPATRMSIVVEPVGWLLREGWKRGRVDATGTRCQTALLSRGG